MFSNGDAPESISFPRRIKVRSDFKETTINDRKFKRLNEILCSNNRDITKLKSFNKVFKFLN